MSELPRATRSYVVLGLLLIAALALAVREHVLRSDSSRTPDDWTRVLSISTRKPTRGSDYRAGLKIDERQLDEVTESGRALLDDPDASPLAAAIAYADARGYGFVLLDLRDDWDFSTLAHTPPPGSMYAAIGVGDVARKGTRVHFGTPVTGPFEYVNPPIDDIAVQLALFEHPDLRALFDEKIDTPVAEGSRWALGRGNGNYEHEREVLLLNQLHLAEVDALWPSESLPGNLAGRWEHVRAVPVGGGLVIEILPMWLDMSHSVSEAELRSAELGGVAFVSNDALVAGADPISARRPCNGLRERDTAKHTRGKLRSFGANLEVSPDGQMLVLHRDTGGEMVDLYRFGAGSPDACELEWVEALAPPLRGVPSPSNSGNLSRVYTSNQVWWWHAGTEHRLAYAGASPDLGSWWLSDNLVAVLGEVSVFESEEDRQQARTTEPAIMLLRTDVASVDLWQLPARARLDADALFPKLHGDDPAAQIIDTRPAGAETLLVVTKACPASHALGEGRLQRPCLHRVRLRTSLHERLGSHLMPTPLRPTRRDLEVHTLGPIDSYLSLAIAPDGTRAAYVAIDPITLDSTPGLFTVTIGETGLGQIERVADAHRKSQLRLSSDGRVLVVESPVTIVPYGERPTARAFVLAPSDTTPAQLESVL